MEDMERMVQECDYLTPRIAVEAGISKFKFYTRSGKGTHQKFGSEEQGECKDADANLYDGAISGESLRFELYGQFCA